MAPRSFLSTSASVADDHPDAIGDPVRRERTHAVDARACAAGPDAPPAG